MHDVDESIALNPAHGWLYYSADQIAAARRSRKAKRAARKHPGDTAFCLAPSELAALTDRERPSAQARVLDRLGITHRRRPDGSLAVLRCHVSPATGPRDIVRVAEPQLVL